MGSILRSTGVMTLLFALASPAFANQPREITLFAFEWREPFAFGWFVPDVPPTVRANSLFGALIAESQKPAAQDVSVARPTAEESWLWRGETRPGAELLW